MTAKLSLFQTRVKPPKIHIRSSESAMLYKTNIFNVQTSIDQLQTAFRCLHTQSLCVELNDFQSSLFHVHPHSTNWDAGVQLYAAEHHSTRPNHAPDRSNHVGPINRFITRGTRDLARFTPRRKRNTQVFKFLSLENLSNDISRILNFKTVNSLKKHSINLCNSSQSLSHGSTITHAGHVSLACSFRSTISQKTEIARSVEQVFSNRKREI